MLIIKRLFTILNYILLFNVAIIALRFWPRNTLSKESTQEKSRWKWKDTIWLIIMLISTGLICAIPFLLLSYNKAKIGSWLLGAMSLSVLLRYAAQIIPSTKTVKHIVTGDGLGSLKLSENIALIILLFLLLVLYSFHIEERIQELILACPSLILRDFLFALFSVFLLSICIFFISALSVNPIKYIIFLAKRLLTHIPISANKFEFLIKQKLFGEMSTETITATSIEFIRRRTMFLKIILSPLILLSAILDIVTRSISYAFITIVSIIWYCYCIIKQIAYIVIQFGDWILLLSDKMVVVISFRLSIIFGLGGIVVINRYCPFFANIEESTAVLEFVSSSIIIPVILEWILSYKPEKKTNKS